MLVKPSLGSGLSIQLHTEPAIFCRLLPASGTPNAFGYLVTPWCVPYGVVPKPVMLPTVPVDKKRVHNGKAVDA